MKEIVIASNNEGKIKEIESIIKDYKAYPQKDFIEEFEVIEDGKTFKENAIKKAETLSKELEGKICIADDSGIEIEYLNGFPGVLTKRWKEGTDRDRNLGLIERLKGINGKARLVKFVVAISASNGEKTICEEGVLEGYIATEPKGNKGFGFDEIFQIEDGRTLAELSEEEKNKISPRRIAIEKMKSKIQELNKK